MDTILVVEEERSIRLAICFTLSEAGFNVVYAESFAEGRHLLYSNNIDLIIVNYSGLEKNELNALLGNFIPVVLITDLFGLPKRFLSSIPRFASSLSFPFSLKTLLSEIDRSLNKKHLTHKSAINKIVSQGA